MIVYKITAYNKKDEGDYVRTDSIVLTIPANSEAHAIFEAKKMAIRQHYEVHTASNDRAVSPDEKGTEKWHKDYVQFTSKAVILLERVATALEGIEKSMKKSTTKRKGVKKDE